MKISERYGQVLKRIARANPEEAMFYKSYKGVRKGLVSTEGQHYERAQCAQEETDLENRVMCLNYDWKYWSHVNRLVEEPKRVVNQDPTYQIIERVWRDADGIFTKLKEKIKFKYKTNSVQNPSAKRHRRFYSQILFDELKKMESRTMTEPQYNLILGNVDEWLKQKYLESGEALNKDDEKRAELARNIQAKLKANEPVSEVEIFALQLSMFS